MKPPVFLSENELKAYADAHLNYELDMLTWSVGILGSIAKRNNSLLVSWTISNGTLNTFAIHARNLIGFLYSRSWKVDRAGDIVLEDYVSEADVKQHLVESTPLLEQALIKANKQVAHLSTRRIEYEKAGKEWYFEQIMADIRGAFASIAPYIPAQRMSDTLRQKLAQGVIPVPVITAATVVSQPAGNEVGLCLSWQAVTSLQEPPM